MTLEEIRAEIDLIDNAIKPLFVRRMECAKHVAEVKADAGGDVYMPERELAVIERRSSDMEADIKEEYIAFLRHLMSVCRRYEYGLLEGMQAKVLEEALHAAGLPADMEHERVEIGFGCSYEASCLNTFVNMAKLNRIGIIRMQAELQEGRQQVTMTLAGNVKDEGMKCLLCQIGKESDGFRILGFK